MNSCSYNLSLPCIFGSVYLIFGGILLLFGGTIYTYYWLILPRGALSLGSFVVFYLVFFMLCGASLGGVVFERAHCPRKYKLIVILLLSMMSALQIIWYDVIFSSLALFSGFIISAVIVFFNSFAFLISFRKFIISNIMLGVLLCWSLYIFWFSLCIMIIN